MSTAFWQCLLTVSTCLSTIQPLLQQTTNIWKIPAQTDVTCSGVLLQLCSRPLILLISSTIWCRFWLISAPLLSESNQRKNRREKLLDCCIPVRLRTSGVDRACEVRDQARRPTRHSYYVMKKPSWCQLGAVPRYWKVVARCFQIVSFAENTSAPLAPRARIFQPFCKSTFWKRMQWWRLRGVLYPIPNPIFCLGAHVLRWLADRNISALSSQQHYRGRSTLPSILQKAARVLGVLRRLRRSLSQAALRTIYICYIRPILEYASVTWSNLTRSEADQLGTIPATSCSPHPWHTAFQEGRPLTSADSSQPPDVRVSQSLRTRGIRTAVVYWSSPQPPQGREPAKTCGNVWTKATTGHPNPHCPYLCLPRLCHS